LKAFPLHRENISRYVEGKNKMVENTEPFFDEIDKRTDGANSCLVLPIFHYKLFNFYICEKSIKIQE
jgi:hypothetical protein